VLVKAIQNFCCPEIQKKTIYKIQLAKGVWMIIICSYRNGENHDNFVVKMRA
jgi:hypothetical protein